MTDLRQAAQQALEFLDAEFGWSPGEAPRIDDLRAALAQQEQEQEQPEQEPVAFADQISFDQAMKSGKGHDVWPKAGDYEARTGRKLRVLYTHPPRRETEQEQEPVVDAETWLRNRYGAARGHHAWRELIEAFNAGRTAAQEQGPVAWTTKGQIAAMENGFLHYIQGRVPRFVNPSENDVALYTHPPRREWQSLTEEEIGDVFQAARNAKLGSANDNSRHRLSVVEIARAIEQALKERNT
jgi:hypothetical protein